MGFDQVTWAPAIGGAGDDLYNVPGATKLDGSIDELNGGCAARGGPSDYSATPTIAEINGRYGINQPIALINRRIRTLNALTGSAIATLAYVQDGKKVRASDIVAIRLAIDTLRSAEGFAAYAWPAAPAAGTHVLGSELAHIRKALRISGTLTLSVAQRAIWSTYVRADHPYGTLQSENIVNFGSGNFPHTFGAGKSTINIFPSVSRERPLASFPVYEYISDAAMIASATLSFTTGRFDTEENQTLELWRSNTDDSGLALGVQAHFDNLVNSYVHPVDGLKTEAIAAADIVAKAGAHLSFLWATTAERQQTGSGVLQFQIILLSGSNPTLAIDFGA